MEKFKGTTGKLKVRHNPDFAFYDVLNKSLGKKYRVAHCSYLPSDESDQAEAKANAQLISKAPELLEAMQEFCDRVDKGEVRSTKTYNKFKELIKQATEV